MDLIEIEIEIVTLDEISNYSCLLSIHVAVMRVSIQSLMWASKVQMRSFGLGSKVCQETEKTLIQKLIRICFNVFEYYIEARNSQVQAQIRYYGANANFGA